MKLTDKQKDFIKNANKRYNIKIGARRCGKTYLDMSYRIPHKVLSLKNENGLNFILGVSKETIERNVLQPMREFYGSDFVGNINSRNIAKLFGQDVYCLGAEKKNQISKIQGSSAKYVYADELAKYNRDVFEMLKGSLDKPYSTLDGALNPENRTHWFKIEFIDKIEEDNLDVYLQHYTIFDNPFLSKDFVENLCKEYKSAGKHYYDRLIMGKWVNAEGSIYKVFVDNYDSFFVDEAEYDTINIGVDFGGNNSHHSFTAVGMTYNHSKLTVLKSERINAQGSTPEMLNAQFERFVAEIITKFGQIQSINCDSAEQVLINGMKKQFPQLPIANARKNAVIDRIRCTTLLMAQGRFFMLKKGCEALAKAFEDAIFDSKSLVDSRVDDGTSDIDSLDSFEYSFEKHMNALVMT